MQTQDFIITMVLKRMQTPDFIIAVALGSAFFSIAIVGFILSPQSFVQIKETIAKQRRTKKGVLLWISPILVTWSPIIDRIPGTFFQKYLLRLKKWLTCMDLEETLLPQEFVGIQALLPLVFGVLLGFSVIQIPELKALRDPQKLLFAALGLSIFGVMVPLLILQDKVTRRQRSISRELPFMLDMLTSAVQAGLDFSGAIRRLLDKSSKETPLKDEMKLMLKEVSVGKTRSDALKRMAERVELKELNSVVSALIQADQLGTSLAVVLTLLSDDLRVRRFQLAEKLALEAPVKMLFPLILFIFPAVFIILLGPLAVQMITGSQ
jgi:tight adherence protein C